MCRRTKFQVFHMTTNSRKSVVESAWTNANSRLERGTAGKDLLADLLQKFPWLCVCVCTRVKHNQKWKQNKLFFLRNKKTHKQHSQFIEMCTTVAGQFWTSQQKMLECLNIHTTHTVVDEKKGVKQMQCYSGCRASSPLLALRAQT